MRYIDTGTRDPSQALGTWLTDVLTSTVAELRWQAGFFSADILGLLAPKLRRLAEQNRLVRAVIGSNGGRSYRNDVLELLTAIGIPRGQATLGVVNYSGGFYHPKTYHVRRLDGSQSAYVGSANLTGMGAAIHVEAGIVLDSAAGDPEDILTQIAAAVDNWFGPPKEGVSLIDGPDSVEALVREGILATIPPPRVPATTTGGGNGGGTGIPRPRLRQLLTLPSVAPTPAGTVPEEPDEREPLPVITNPSTSREGFPEYLRFAPNAQQPTRGASALTGIPLQPGAAGLIIRLNRDSARGFEGRVGTANMSIPVPTVGTLRFGVMQGKYVRPRGEYGLAIRYLGDDTTINVPDLATNVMTYGIADGETGHRDIRMLVPAGINTLKQAVQSAGRPIPAEGDVAFLEWPTLQHPGFRLSFLQRGSSRFDQADRLLNEAIEHDEVVGKGACWLPEGLSPAW